MRARLRMVGVGVSVVLAGVALVGVPATEAAPEDVVSTTYSYTGALQSFVVPAGICGLTIEATGGSGGDAGAGLGVEVTADIDVTPGETLSVLVAGAGAAGLESGAGDGGFGGGGGGGNHPSVPSGGGGGASMVGRSDVALIVAGGGGGGGVMDGGDAGMVGQHGENGESFFGTGTTIGGEGGRSHGAGGASGSWRLPGSTSASSAGSGGGVTVGGPSDGAGLGGAGHAGFGGGGGTSGVGGGTAGVGQTGAGGVGSGDGGAGTADGGVGGSVDGPYTGGGGGGGLGFGGGGGGLFAGGGGGGYGGGGGGGGGGSSYVDPAATGVSSQVAAAAGDGVVTISYDGVDDACPTSVLVRVADTSGDPVVGADVRRYLPPSGFQGSLVTDANGEAEFTVLPGSYRFRVAAPGFAAEWWDDAYTSNVSALVPVAEGESVVLDVELLSSAEAGSIAGVVSDEVTAAPVVGLSVRLYEVGVGFVVSTPTDAAGNYSFAGLPAGDYRVRFGPGGGFVSEWFDGVAEGAPALATTLSVASGVDVSANAALVSTAAAPTIGGVVTEAGSGAPIAGARVRLYSPPKGFVVQVLTGADGSYDFGVLPSGSYAVRADASGHVLEWFDNSPTVAGRTVVNVGPGDDQVANFALGVAG